MTIQDLAQKDPTFNSELFITKANLMIKKILYAITLNDLAKVDHFISDKLYNNLLKQIENAHKNGYDLIYDEINVNTIVKNVKDEMGIYTIIADANIKCLKYLKSKEDNSIADSDRISLNSQSINIHAALPSNRINLTKRVVFKKVQNTENRDTNRCRGCGTTYNINESGICPTCGRVFDLEKVDYYIAEFE